MQEDSQDCRATALRVAKRALKRVERCDDDELIVPEVADVLNKHTKTAGMAGAWQSTAPLAKINLSIVTGTQPPTLDAEFTEMPVSQDIMDY